MKLCAPKPARTQSPKPLVAMLNDKDMRYNSITIFLLICILLSCSDNQDSIEHHLFERHYGVYFDHSMRTGSGFKNSLNEDCFFFNVRALITNDSTIPLNVNINLPKDSLVVIPLHEPKFIALILPESMTNRKQRGENGQISDELKLLIDSLLTKPISIIKTINPKESCVVNLAILMNNKYDLNPYFSIFSAGHKPHPWPRKAKLHPADLSDSILSIPYSAIHNSNSQDNNLQIYLGVRHYNFDQTKDSLKPYTVVPCGQLTYLK